MSEKKTEKQLQKDFRKEIDGMIKKFNLHDCRWGIMITTQPDGKVAMGFVPGYNMVKNKTPTMVYLIEILGSLEMMKQNIVAETKAQIAQQNVNKIVNKKALEEQMLNIKPQGEA